jgi:hypothetical protein
MGAATTPSADGVLVEPDDSPRHRRHQLVVGKIDHVELLGFGGNLVAEEERVSRMGQPFQFPRARKTARIAGTELHSGELQGGGDD